MGGARVTLVSEVKALGRCPTAAWSLKYSAFTGETEALEVNVEVRARYRYRAGIQPVQDGGARLGLPHCPVVGLAPCPRGTSRGCLFAGRRLRHRTL